MYAKYFSLNYCLNSSLKNKTNRKTHWLASKPRVYWFKRFGCVCWFLSIDIISTAPPTIREENCKWKSHQQAHKQILLFLTYWLCLFKFHATLSEVLHLVKSHFLINITHWFSALTLEHYMTLTYMPWRIPPWRTWNHFINTFPYFHMIIEEAWTWPLRWESSRAQGWSFHSFIFL